MRVAYIVENYETFIVDEIRRLRECGLDIVVFNAFRPGPEQDPVKEDIRQHALYFPPRYRGVIGANVRAFIRRPIVYLQLLLLLIRTGGTIRMLALGAFYAAVIDRRGIAHVHATFATRTATVGYTMARLAAVPFSFTTHAYDIFIPNPTLVWKTQAAVFVRTISAFNRRFITNMYPTVDAAKIHVMYLGVNLEEFNPIPASRSERIRVLTVGRLVPTKGHQLLVEACEGLVRAGLPISCRIVGDGEQYDSLRADIERRALHETVDLSGPLSHDAVRHVLGDTEVFVLACRQATDSHDQDGIPVALMEAMATGVPVVATSISGIPELIVDRVSGLLVPPDDAGALTKAIAELVRDKALRDRLGAGGRRRIEERFNTAVNTDELVKLFISHTPRQPGASTSVTGASISVAQG